MNRALVISEAGSAHDLNLDRALSLIRAAKLVGADIVKFQTFKAETLAMRRRTPESLLMYAKYEMPLGWLEPLRREADRCGIEFMTTVYHEDYLPIVNPFVRRFKIGSFEAQDEAFLQAHRAFGKQTIISTGLCDEPALGTLLALRQASFGAWDVRLLHCLSAYPAPLDQLNLGVITRYELDGLSDHTTSLLTGAWAVMAGAGIVEKHLRLDDTDPGNPDFPHSLPPAEFTEYVQQIRLAETALGDGRKRPARAEAPWARFVVRSSRE